MAVYQDSGRVRRRPIRGVFDQIYVPPHYAPSEGIYQCVVCGDEIVAREQELLPDQGHHRHQAPGQRGKPIAWRLLVMIEASNPRA
jgi:hypothetical protein